MLDNAGQMKRKIVSPSPKPVLVLDGETASALAIVRSLGRKGLRVEIGACTTDPLAALSRYCSRHFVYPHPLVEALGFQKALLEHLAHHSYAAVIPVTDLTICPLMAIRESVEALSPLVMASNEALSVALSKSRTCRLANRLGVPIPKTHIIRHLDELHGVPELLGYPLVIKADRSKIWLSNGKGQESAVTYALNAKECYARISRLLPLGPIVLQEYIGGDGVGLGMLAARGKTLFAFQYRRLHEVPVTGGASSYRVSEAIDPELIDYAVSLLEVLCWDGVAMVEFKRESGTGKKYLMEINGRFWGSLPLALAAGANFPSYLFDLVVHHQDEFPQGYKVGLRCRDLSRERDWLKDVLLGRKEAGEIVQLPSYRSVLIDSCRLLNPLERLDTLEYSDPLPGISEVYGLARRTAKDIWNKSWYLREKRKITTLKHNPTFLLHEIRRAKTILIVCRGNIIRSPFAAQFLSRAVANRQSVSVYSAGIEAVSDQPAHPHAVTKARTFGVDLSAHSSMALTTEMVVRADVILVMEVAHFRLLLQRFSGVRKKTFLLGCFSSEIPLEIADPIGGDEAIFEECFDQLIKALKPIAHILSTCSAHR